MATRGIHKAEVATCPERRLLQRTLPQGFVDSFGDQLALIIDCFEVNIERPYSLRARCETWSQYKIHNTAKFLTGICPQGVITSISDGWGGRTPDKVITEHCGVLDKLMPGDVVPADQGFDIADSIGLFCAKLHMPASTKGKKQLSPQDVESTTKIANVRIHVERVIALLRNKYLILKGTVPIAY